MNHVANHHYKHYIVIINRVMNHYYNHTNHYYKLVITIMVGNGW